MNESGNDRSVTSKDYFNGLDIALEAIRVKAEKGSELMKGIQEVKNAIAAGGDKIEEKVKALITLWSTQKLSGDEVKEYKEDLINKIQEIVSSLVLVLATEQRDIFAENGDATTAGGW